MTTQLALVDERAGRPVPAVKPRPAPAFTYYLGGRPNWLNGDHTASNVPLFISATTLTRYNSGPEGTWGPWDDFPVQRWGNWALDSGAFTALTSTNEAKHPWWLDWESYGALVTRLVDDIGMPDFAAPQDWPCEPIVRERTGLTVREHIELTVDNFLRLREDFPHIPWIPVLQGWEAEDYLYCEQLYLDAGVDLAGEYRVGIGSICRRGHVPSIVKVIEQFAARGYRMHGFGVKITALPVIGHLLASADSYAWSDTARKDRVMHKGCAHRTRACVKGCAAGCVEHLTDCRNCHVWAQAWRREVLGTVPARESSAATTRPVPVRPAGAPRPARRSARRGRVAVPGQLAVFAQDVAELLRGG